MGISVLVKRLLVLAAGMELCVVYYFSVQGEFN